MLLRILPGKAPDLEQIGYHTIFRPQLTNKPTQPGIFLVTGETGSGKSTLLAGVLQEYLNRYPIHIVTVEDPVEYLLFDACGEVSQREIPDDVESFAESVVNVLREDPDIIFFGEMRDPATAIAAEQGVPKAANTVMLAALAHLGAAALPRERLLAALDASFARKPKLIPVNRTVFDAALAWCRDHQP